MSISGERPRGSTTRLEIVLSPLVYKARLKSISITANFPDLDAHCFEVENLCENSRLTFASICSEIIPKRSWIVLRMPIKSFNNSPLQAAILERTPLSSLLSVTLRKHPHTTTSSCVFCSTASVATRIWIRLLRWVDSIQSDLLSIM